MIKILLILFSLCLCDHEPFFIFAKSKSDTTVISANGNYSITNDTFFLAPPSNKVYMVNRMLVSIEDNLTPEAGDYGGINGGLTNGIEIKINRIDNIHTVITNGLPIKTNINWAVFCYDVGFQTFGSGNNYVYVRWSFFRSGKPLRLDGPSRDTLMIILKDDLSSLESHYFQFQGFDLD